MSDFKIEYYDSGSSSWVEISNWEGLSIKYPNGLLQLAPIAEFTVDKDISLTAHQKIRISSIASDGTTTRRFEGHTKSKGSLTSGGHKKVFEVRGYGYEIMKKSINIDLSSTDTISILQEAISGTNYTIDSTNATSINMNSYKIDNGKIEDVFTDIISEGSYIFRIAPDKTIYVEDEDGRGEYANIDIQTDPATITEWEEGHIDTVRNKIIGKSTVEFTDREKWSNSYSDTLYSIDRDGDRIYISSLDTIRCLDIDGSQIWMETGLTGEGEDSDIKGLSVEGSKLLIGTGNGNVKLYDILDDGLSLIDSHSEHGSSYSVITVLFKDSIALSIGTDENLIYAEYSSGSLNYKDKITVAIGYRPRNGIAMRDDTIIATNSAKIYAFIYDSGSLSEITIESVGTHKDCLVYDDKIFLCYDNNIGIITFRNNRLELLNSINTGYETISLDIEDGDVAVGHGDSNRVSYLTYDSEGGSFEKIFTSEIHTGGWINNAWDIVVHDGVMYSPSKEGDLIAYYTSKWREVKAVATDEDSISKYGERMEKYNIDYPQTPEDLDDAVQNRLQPQPQPKGKMVMGGSLYSAGDIVNHYVTLSDASMNVSSQQMTIDEQAVTPSGVELVLGGAATVGKELEDLRFRSREDIDRISYETVRRLD